MFGQWPKAVCLLVIAAILLSAATAPNARAEMSGVTLTVLVLDEFGKPLMGAHVTVYPPQKEFKYRESKLTGNDGMAVFVLPRISTYDVEASAPEYSNAIVTIELTEGDATRFISVSLQKGGTIGTAQVSEFPETGDLPILGMTVVSALGALLILRRRSSLVARTRSERRSQ